LATVSDDFNRANSASLGANWVEIESSTTVFQVTSNTLRIRKTTTARGLAHFNQSFNNDQFSELEYRGNISAAFGGPAIRIDPASTVADCTCYGVMVDDGGSPDIRLLKWNGVAMTFVAATTLATDSHSVSVGEVIRIEATGTTIRVLVDDVEKISVTDADIGSGRLGMVSPSIAGFTLVGIWDNFAGGDLNGGISLNPADQLKPLSDAVSLNLAENLTLTPSDSISRLDDEISTAIAEFLRITVADSLGSSPALADSVALALFENLTINASDALKDLDDSFSINLIENLTVAVADALEAPTDAIEVVTGQFFGVNVLILVTMFLSDGDDCSASVGVRTPDKYFEGRVIQYGTLERSIEVPAGLPRVADGQLTLADTDQKYRKKFAAANPRGREIEISMVPVGGSTKTAQRVYRGEITRVSFPEGAVTVEYSDITFAWMEEDLPALGTVENFPALPDPDQTEVFIPIIFGHVFSDGGLGSQGAIRADSVDVSRKRFALARHPMEELTTVYRRLSGEDVFSVVASGFSVVEEDQTIDGVVYTFSFLDFVSAQADGTEIRFDGKGVKFLGGSLATRNPATCIHRYLNLFADQGDSKLNLIDFATAETEADSRALFCDGAIVSKIRHREAVARLASSFNIDFFQDKNAKISISITPETDAGRPVFDDLLRLLSESVSQSLPDPVFNRLKYSFNRLFADGEFRTTLTHENEPDQSQLGKVLERNLELWFVRDAATAQSVTQDVASYLALDSYQIQFGLPAPLTVDQLELAALAGVTHYGGIDGSASGYSNEEFKILGIGFDPNTLRYTVKGIRRNPSPSAPVGQAFEVWWAENCTPGPHMLAAGIFTLIFLEDDDISVVNAWRTLDWGRSWEKIPGPNLADLVRSYASAQSGVEIHVATQEDATGRVSYHVFNASSAAWTLKSETIKASVTLKSSQTQHLVDITVARTGGFPTVIFNDDIHTDGSPAVEYHRLSIAQKRSGSWNLIGNLATGGNNDWRGGRLAAGKGDLIHAFFMRTPGLEEGYHQTLNNGGALTATVLWRPQSLFSGSTHNFGKIGVMQDGEDFKIWVAYRALTDIAVVTFISAATMGQVEAADTDVWDITPFQGESVPDGSTRMTHVDISVTVDGVPHASFPGFIGLAGPFWTVYKSFGENGWNPPGTGSDPSGDCLNTFWNACAFEDKLGPKISSPQSPKKHASLVFLFGGDYWIASITWMSLDAASKAALGGPPDGSATIFEVAKIGRDIPRPDDFVQLDLINEIKARGVLD